jgi:hypothetical protein
MESVRYTCAGCGARFPAGSYHQCRGTHATIPPAVLSAADVERLLRREWWLNHGHDLPALYSDDGEMQCIACSADYKRDPLEELQRRVLVERARQVPQ